MLLLISAKNKMCKAPSNLATLNTLCQGGTFICYYLYQNKTTRLEQLAAHNTLCQRRDISLLLLISEEDNKCKVHSIT